MLLFLSKRLHSIFVLRLFNDCWSVVFSQAAILAIQVAADDIGVLFYRFVLYGFEEPALFTPKLSLALSVKMSTLLYLPGLLVILFKRHGLVITARYLTVLSFAQALLGWPFLSQNVGSYLGSAFDFSRVFLYKWTVNWRIINEETFLSPLWAKGLLLGHLATLVAFGLFKWCRVDSGALNVVRNGFRNPWRPPAPSSVSPDCSFLSITGGGLLMQSADVATVLMTSNLIGILFARSLHYQFYSWYSQQIPFLCQRTKYPLVLQYVSLGLAGIFLTLQSRLAILAGIEYAWNVYPSTTLSSGTLLAANGLLLIGVWSGFPEGKPDINLLIRKSE